MKSAQGTTITMASANGVVKEEDEDELETLRLAALESLRAKGLPPPAMALPTSLPQMGNSNQVFQRHFGNQNLIAIIPVDHSTNLKPESKPASPFPNSSALLPTPPDFERVVTSTITRVSSLVPPLNPLRNLNLSRPPLRPAPPAPLPIDHSAEEKPRASTKFSRFEDSDSDESDDFEMSLAKSESEEEEIVIEEGEEEDDLIIEVEDFIVLEEVNGTEEDHQTTNTDENPEKSSPVPLVVKQQPVSPPKKIEPPKIEPPKIEPPKVETSRIVRLEVESEAKRSPQYSSSTRSPAPSRRRSPAPTQKPTSEKIRHSEFSSRNGDAKKDVKSSKESQRRDRSPPSRKSPQLETKTKLAAPSPLTDSERLESRKRKFETVPDVEPPVKKEGKIRLRTGDSPPRAPPVKSSTEVATIKKEDNSLIDKKKSNSDLEKKIKKSKKKSKDKKRKRSRTRSGEHASVVLPVKRSKSVEPSAEQDLRAELQRRRIHRFDEDEESRSRTPEKNKESRRILVLKSPSPSTGRTSLTPPKSSAESTGVLSKNRRSSNGSVRKKSGPSTDTRVVAKRGGVQLKRTLLASSIDVDQGRETDPLEDRIRLIQARNEQIRKRQLEIEADKLQYA